MEADMAVKVLLSLCFVGAFGLVMYLYHILWLVPQRVLAKFRDQNIGGPPPSFPYGNLADMREAVAAAKAARASARQQSGAPAGAGIVHDYRPAVLPYYEKWRKEYVGQQDKLGGLAITMYSSLDSSGAERRHERTSVQRTETNKSYKESREWGWGDDLALVVAL